MTTDTELSKNFVADHTVERTDRPIVDGPNKFKMAIFGANVSTGQGGLTLAENMIKLGNWDEIKGLAQKADRYGVEGFIPIARWQGLAGPDRPWGRQFETFTWAAGLAAATEQIQIFATCHVSFIHPLMAAKMAMTIDHISGGRMGLNATAGYFQSEYDMFGAELVEHDKRYEVADEWMTIVEKLWSDKDVEFDFDGEFYQLKGAQSYPKPVQSPGPVVMSAGSSPAGQKFAFDHANILYVSAPSIDGAKAGMSKIRGAADAAGRPDLALWAPMHIICKDTEKEALDYARYVDEQGDQESASRYLHVLKGGDTRSMSLSAAANDPKHEETARMFFRAGMTSIVGTPEMIVDSLVKLSEAGLGGVAAGLVDYDEGLDRMHEQIFPLMRSAGLRA
jgi:alkanesulfonate monooxygenase SsuD/methylene tetrahydromethanopterin reductase-like flavin-dependent oxidoreductase (luciferase family)